MKRGMQKGLKWIRVGEGLGLGLELGGSVEHDVNWGDRAEESNKGLKTQYSDGQAWISGSPGSACTKIGNLGFLSKLASGLFWTRSFSWVDHFLISHLASAAPGVSATTKNPTGKYCW